MAAISAVSPGPLVRVSSRALSLTVDHFDASLSLCHQDDRAERRDLSIVFQLETTIEFLRRVTQYFDDDTRIRDGIVVFRVELRNAAHDRYVRIGGEIRRQHMDTLIRAVDVALAVAKRRMECARHADASRRTRPVPRRQRRSSTPRAHGLLRNRPSPPITAAFVTLRPRQSSARQRAVDPNQAAARAVSQSNGLPGWIVSAEIRETRFGAVFFAAAGTDTSNKSATSAVVDFSMERPSFVSRRVREATRVARGDE
jgi:hypothetical protein